MHHSMVMDYTLDHTLHCGTCFVITHIDYLRPMRVADKKLIHDTTEIKTDSDVAQMIKRWKQV